MLTYGPAQGSTQPLLHAWRVWANISAIRCTSLLRPESRARGSPRLKGEYLPDLSVPAEDPATDWCSEEKRNVEVASARTAVWYGTGLPAVPLRSALIRDLGRSLRPKLSSLHRSRCRSRADHLVVRQAVANGSDLTRSTSTARKVRDTEAMVGEEKSIRRIVPVLLSLFLCLRSSPTSGCNNERRATSGDRLGTTRFIRPSPTLWRW
jgi:hypothetical protein